MSLGHTIELQHSRNGSIITAIFDDDNECFSTAFDFISYYFGKESFVEGFSDGAFTHLEASLTNITGNTPVQVAHYQNLTPNATFVPIPYSCSSASRFYELKVRGVNDCGTSGWQLVIIDLDHPGGPDLPLIASQILKSYYYE